MYKVMRSEHINVDSGLKPVTAHRYSRASRDGIEQRHIEEYPRELLLAALRRPRQLWTRAMLTRGVNWRDPLRCQRMRGPRLFARISLMTSMSEKDNRSYIAMSKRYMYGLPSVLQYKARSEGQMLCDLE